MMQKTLKQLLVVALTLIMVSGVAIESAPLASAAKIPESNTSCQIKAYPKANSRVQVYTNEQCSTAGRNEYISPSDECYILKISLHYNSVYVSYPTSRGRKTRWVKASAFFNDATVLTGAPVTMISPGKITTYKKNSTSSGVYGSLAKEDKLYLLDTSGAMTSVAYPISGGWYKIGWVRNVDLCTVSNGNYKIRSMLSKNLCVDVYNASTQNGANVWIYNDNNESNAQNFTLQQVKDGWYVIKNMGSGKVLDVAGGNRASGTNVQQYTYNGTDSQLWQLINTDYGNVYYIKNKLGCYLDVCNGEAKSGVNLWVHSFNGSTAQRFTFTGAGSVSAPSNNQAPTNTSTNTIAPSDRLYQIKQGEVKLNNSTVLQAGRRFTGTRSNEQCKGYAKNVYSLMFGVLPPSTQRQPNNYLLTSSSSMRYMGTASSASDIKSLLLQGRSGSFLQMRRSHGGSHSAILYSATNDSVRFLEANTDGNNTIMLNEYTWTQLANKNQKISLYY